MTPARGMPSSNTGARRSRFKPSILGCATGLTGHVVSSRMPIRGARGWLLASPSPALTTPSSSRSILCWPRVVNGDARLFSRPVAVATDALLTITQAVWWNGSRVHSWQVASWVLFACAGPVLTAPVLWGALRRWQRSREATNATAATAMPAKQQATVRGR